MRTRSGLALLLVVGVLGILAVLAAAFVTMAQLERRASMQRLYATKALLLARSGIEDALARLGAGQDADDPVSRYRGEDWDASGALDGLEPQAEVYQLGKLDVEGCPTKQALRPSFYVRDALSVGADGLKAPRRRKVEGRDRGLTGVLSGDQTAGGNAYALKVKSGGLYVNGGDPAAAPAEGYNTVLRRILGTLAEAIDREDGVPGDGPVAQADGLNLIDLRPRVPEGWTGWEQVRDLALGGSQGKLDALKPYLTLHAWVDTRTLKPDATTDMQDVDVHTWSEIKLGVDATYTPTRGMPVLESRAPVNLAWARSRWPVLVALMGGLKGLYLHEKWSTREIEIDVRLTDDCVGRLIAAELVLDWDLLADPCRKIASKLAGYPGPLDTWDDWNAFCDTLTSDLLDNNTYPDVPAMRSLLKANFNPNSRLNKFNPNRAMWHLVDKQDLLVYSTEFVLEPVQPHELESVGRVLGRDGRLLSSRTLRSEIAGPKVARLSTQREFVCKDLGSLDRAGDETGVRFPGTDSPFLPASHGPAGTATWGQDLPGLGGKGVGIQPYPEPYVDLDPAPLARDLALSPADYDGSLQLATLETLADDTYGAPDAPPNDMKMLARYTADMDLDVSDAFALTGVAAKRRNQPDAQQAPVTNSLLHPSVPNTLHPDGCYSERDRAPGYFDRDNANGFHGLMTFWFKPNYHHVGDYLDEDGSLVSSDRNLSRRRQFVKWTNFMSGVENFLSRDQCFALVHGDSTPAGRFSCFFEIGHDAADAEREHEFETPVHVTRPHRWRLLTFAWDLQANNKQRTGDLVMDDGTATSDLGTRDVYHDSTGNTPTAASDLTADDRFGDYEANGRVAGTWPHLICLGRRGYLKEMGLNTRLGLGADTTFDEFAIYDFGPASGEPDPVPAALALDRFRKGRYGKESAYPASAGLLVPPGFPSRTAAEYFSAPIDLGGGRLVALSWTQMLPRGLKSPLPLGGRPGIDGDRDDGDDPGDGVIWMEFADAALPDDGKAYAPDASGRPIDTTFTRSALSRVDRTPAGPFRLHAVFKPNLADKENTPILDPLALDDITVLYEPPGGRALLSWDAGA